jgi:hypothetical protein
LSFLPKIKSRNAHAGVCMVRKVNATAKTVAGRWEEAEGVLIGGGR